MTKEEILKEFNDINHVYNDCTKYDTLKRMLEELELSNNEEQLKKLKVLEQKPCKDMEEQLKKLKAELDYAKIALEIY